MFNIKRTKQFENKRERFYWKKFISELHVNVLMFLRTMDEFYCVIQKNPLGEKHNLLWGSTALKIYGFWTTNYIKKNLVSWWDMCSHNSILDICFQKKLLAQKQTSDCLVFLEWFDHGNVSTGGDFINTVSTTRDILQYLCHICGTDHVAKQGHSNVISSLAK